MALATRCPNCHALFRVVADQLKLRGGLVRCGACEQVFDAIGTLSYIDDAALSATGAAPMASGPAAAAPPAGAGASTVATAYAMQPIEGALAPTPRSAPPEHLPSVTEPAAEVTSELPGDDADRFAGQPPAPTLADADDGVQAPPAEAADDEARVVAGADVEPSAEAQAPPAFLRDEDARRRRRGFSIVFGSGTVLLALLALVQLAVMYRADILVMFPEARPALTQLCRVFRCTVNWPARGELLAVVGSELQALPGTSAFELTAIVRNRGSHTLALPAIELTLTDTLNRMVARKVFAPIDYLAAAPDPQGRLLAGVEAGADLTIKVAFEARGLNAAGFVVYPFYL